MLFYLKLFKSGEVGQARQALAEAGKKTAFSPIPELPPDLYAGK